MSITANPAIAGAADARGVRGRYWTEEWWGTPLASAIAFMVLYNVTFAAMPSPSTLGAVTRFGTLSLIAFGGVAFTRFIAVDGGLALMLVALVGYAAAQWAVTGMNDLSQTVRLFAFVLYGVYTPLLLATVFHGDDVAFARACTIAALVQAAFIVISFMSPEYRAWLSGVVQQSGNIDLVTGFGAPGFSNSAGALLSVEQSAGVFAALYAAHRSTRPSATIAYTLSAFAIAGSTVLAGRTGLLLSVLFIGAFAIAGVLRRQWAMIGAIGGGALALAGAGTLLLTIVAAKSGADVDFLRSWAFDLFQHGTGAASYTDLQSQPIPALSVSTVFGTGLVTALPPWTGNASGNDSGYIQTYFALGLAAAVLFYGTVALLAARAIARARLRWLLAVLAVAMFAIEAKEPFMFKSPLPLMLFTFAFMPFGAPEGA